MTRHLIGSLLLLMPLTTATPFQDELLHPLVARQAIPDRYGNTGNRPASAAIASPSASLWEATISAIVWQTPTSTITISSPRAVSTYHTTMTTTSPVPQSSLPTSIASTSTPCRFSTTASATPSPSPLNPWIRFPNTNPPNLLTPAAITGIVVGSTIFLALIFITLLLLHRRKRARAIKEITRPRVVPKQHYNPKIPRSRRSTRWWSPRQEVSGSSVSSWGSLGNEKLIRTYNSPVSPSVYTLPRESGNSFGNFMREEEVVIGTLSQLLDAPRPLIVDKKWAAEVGYDDEGTKRYSALGQHRDQRRG
jgi:hypothetical protein